MRKITQTGKDPVARAVITVALVVAVLLAVYIALGIKNRSAPEVVTQDTNKFSIGDGEEAPSAEIQFRAEADALRQDWAAAKDTWLREHGQIMVTPSDTAEMNKALSERFQPRIDALNKKYMKRFRARAGVFTTGNLLSSQGAVGFQGAVTTGGELEDMPIRGEPCEK